MSREKQIERIAQMEQRLDASEEVLRKLTDALDAYEQNQKELKKLMDYYGSSRWMKDFQDDEAGKLPKDLKRGVLSEDELYDLIFDHRDAVLTMSRLVADAIAGRML